MATFTKRITADEDDCFYYNGTLYSSDYYMKAGYSGSGGSSHAGMRFLNITIPKGSTITSAKITHKARSNSGAITASISIYGNDVDNATTFSADGSNEPQNKVRTTEVVNWSPPFWYNGTIYDGPDIKNIIQEIINRDGWASGNNLSILYINNGETINQKLFDSFYANSSTCALLTIEYTEPVTFVPQIIII